LPRLEAFLIEVLIWVGARQYVDLKGKKRIWQGPLAVITRHPSLVTQSSTFS